jgi:hypothetical protein
MNGENYSIVVFPYLKTRSPLSIAGFTFRSTESCEDLLAEHVKSVSEISSMLYIKDDLRIRSASFAIIPYLNFGQPSSLAMMRLAHLHAAISYLYASPHPISGDAFLSPEHASIAIFNPERVSIYLVRPPCNAVADGVGPSMVPDSHGYAAGFAGLFNFRHHFWVGQGSRLYAPQPQLMLNEAQDLSNDIATGYSNSPYLGLLFDRLDGPTNEFSLRVFGAIRWFNGANRSSIDPYEAIVNLSIAFESLLALPQTEKTDRLVDSISLLLGRLPRLSSWARQFYDARSQIVHEGRSNRLYFLTTDDTSKSAANAAAYQSLLSYGRQIFRLCLGTLLAGASMAEHANLEEKLISNQERYEKICKALGDERVAPRDRLTQIAALVDAVECYQFVPEELKVETMIGAARLAAKALLAAEPALKGEVTQKLGELVNAKRGDKHLAALEALRNLDEALPESFNTVDSEHGATFRKLLKVVWMSLFGIYFYLKQHPGA